MVTTLLTESVKLRETKVCVMLPLAEVMLMACPLALAVKVALLSSMSPPTAPVVKVMPPVLAVTWVSASAVRWPLLARPWPDINTTLPALMRPERFKSRPAEAVTVMAAPSTALTTPPSMMSRSPVRLTLAVVVLVAVFCTALSSAESATVSNRPANKLSVSACNTEAIDTVWLPTTVVAALCTRSVSSALRFMV